jgi:hypothetical protein
MNSVMNVMPVVVRSMVAMAGFSRRKQKQTSEYDAGDTQHSNS